jgi:Trk K+ transport system NAD-binding subunit
VLSVLLVLVLVTGYILSPISYFTVTFNQPLTAQEYLKFLDDNGINPSKHSVYVLKNQIHSSNEINYLDFEPKEGAIISDTVFNTKLYALKALSDQRVQSWEFMKPTQETSAGHVGPDNRCKPH